MIFFIKKMFWILIGNFFQTKLKKKSCKRALLFPSGVGRALPLLCYLKNYSILIWIIFKPSSIKVVKKQLFHVFQVLGGPSASTPSPSFVGIPYHSSLLTRLLQLHATGSDCCLVGPKGSGKTAIISEMASLLGYTVEPILLYQVFSKDFFLNQRGEKIN